MVQVHKDPGVFNTDDPEGGQALGKYTGYIPQQAGWIKPSGPGYKFMAGDINGVELPGTERQQLARGKPRHNYPRLKYKAECFIFAGTKDFLFRFRRENIPPHVHIRSIIEFTVFGFRALPVQFKFHRCQGVALKFFHNGSIISCIIPMEKVAIGRKVKFSFFTFPQNNSTLKNRTG
jgi:hypothetical protein